MTRGRLVELAVNRGGILGLAAFALYAALAPTWMLGGDASEFAAIGANGGVPHPSGYPLYVLWLRATSWIPAASPAHAAALATAVLGAAHVVMLHAACRAWGARPAAATFAVGIYAGAPLAMLLYSQAEVFALNGLAVSTILWLAAPAGPVTGGRRTVLLALVAGLAMSNHMTSVLVAPLGLYGAVEGLREARTRRLAIAAAAAGAFVLGLAPYLYLLVAPATPPSWGRIDGLGDLFHHVLRRDYGSTGLVATLTPPQPLPNLAALAASLARTWLWVGLAVGVVTAFGCAARGDRRLAWTALAATIVATSLIVMRFNIVPVEVNAWIVERFHLLPALVLAIPIAVGIDKLAARVERRIDVRARTRHLAVAVAFLALPIAAAPSLDHVRRGHSPAVDRAVHGILATLPADAVVLTTGDHLLFGFAYAQSTLGVRPDVVCMTYGVLALSWYQAPLVKRLGFPLIPDGPEQASVRLAENILAHGRPLFVDGEQRLILRALPSYPDGPLFRVLPRGAEPPDLGELLARNRRILDGLDLRYTPPAVSDGWSELIHRMYARWWGAVAGGMRSAGRDADAAEATAIAEALAPR